jgi:ankyrin repeat protein
MKRAPGNEKRAGYCKVSTAGQDPGGQLWEAARDGDAAKVSTLLSTQGAQSFINYQAHTFGHCLFGYPAGGGLVARVGATPLHAAASLGHAAVTEQLIAAGCNVDLQMQDGCTALFEAGAKGCPKKEKHLVPNVLQ